MSGRLFDRYGAILDEDVEVLEACLTDLCSRLGSVSVLEIGMHDGGTAKGIEHFLFLRFKNLEYWGIDPDEGKRRPRYVPTGGKVIIGDSAEVFNQVPDRIDLVWVDGCHCFNHVALDTLHYAPKVVSGGFICFHDINPAGEGLDHQYHGPDIPEFGLATTQAHRAIGFPWAPWTLFAEKWPADVKNCGTRAFRKQ